MRSLGANLEIIKSSDGKINKELITKMIKKADQISKEPNTFFTNQLNNTDVIEGFIPLGEEILDQLNGNIDAVCDTVGTAGSGFNSKDYDFFNFTVTSINAIQGNSRVTYKISEVVGSGTSTGTFDSLTSFARVIKLDDLAKFDAILDSSNYTPGESVFTNNGYTAVVDEDGWNSKNKVLSLKNQSARN